MKQAKPIPPVKRDERIYQGRLIAFLRTTIQAPLAGVVVRSKSIEEILTGATALASQTLNINDLGADVVEDQFGDIARRHGKRFKASMGGAIPDIDLKLNSTTIGVWLQKKTADNVALIKGMNTYQYEKFNEKINKLFTGGEFDRQAVAQAAQDSFNIGRNKAKLIGRDQVSKAYGELNNIRQKDVGITKYRWLTSGDERVRPTHAANNGKIFEWDNPPSTGHPSHDVNCFAGYTSISELGFINKLFRRWYTGKATKIVTNDGNVFTCTPNHQFLTVAGWIAAKDLNVGDNVINIRNKAFFIPDGDVDNSMTFADLFGSMSKVFGVESTKGLHSQFHGDGTNEKVDIVNINSKLRDNIDISDFARIEESIFKWAKVSNSFLSSDSLVQSFINGNSRTTSGLVGFICDFLPSLKAEIFHSLKHGFASVSRVDSASLEEIGDCGSSASDLFGDMLDTFPAIELINDILAVEILSIMWGSVMPDNFPTCGADSFAEIIGAAIEAGGNLTEIHSPFHHGVSVINEVSSVDFTGHVYNLENENNYYGVGSGLVSHNCRCTAIPILDD